MPGKDLKRFKSLITTWTKWQLMGKDRIYREDLEADLLDDLDQQRWNLVRGELERRGFQYDEDTWVRKGK